MDPSEERRERRAVRAAQVRRRRVAALAALLCAGAVTIAVASGGGGGEGGGLAGAIETRRAEAPRAADKPVRISLEANGDLLIHSPIFERARALGGGERYDFRPMLAEIKPYVAKADLALCHMETPMTSDPPAGFPVFNTPPDLASAIRDTGWDACSTASNHTLDKGEPGVAGTLEALDRAGVKHYGSARTQKEADSTTMVDVKGVKVAMLAYTEMSNGVPLPKPWSVNLAKASEILADARAARQRGARVVIVNMHWGAEYQHEPSTSQLALAKTLARSPDVTAIVGQHVHVVQPIQRVGGKIVVFGEGNLLSNQTAGCCPAASQDGILALLDLVVEGDTAKVERVRYVPTYVRISDYVVLPVGEALREESDDPAALRASYERTVDVVGRGPGIEPIPATLPR